MSQNCVQIMRFDMSTDSLNVTRSESVTDLNSELSGLPHPRRASVGHARNEENFLTTPPKPFGIGKQFFVVIYLSLIITDKSHGALKNISIIFTKNRSRNIKLAP